jgi:hypothetical protein
MWQVEIAAVEASGVLRIFNGRPGWTARLRRRRAAIDGIDLAVRPERRSTTPLPGTALPRLGDISTG